METNISLLVLAWFYNIPMFSLYHLLPFAPACYKTIHNKYFVSRWFEFIWINNEIFRNIFENMAQQTYTTFFLRTKISNINPTLSY